MKPFLSEQFARLHHELAMSPRRLRVQQIAGIIRTAALIDLRRDYPFSFLSFQVTGFRPRRSEDETLVGGKTVVNDLALLAEALSESHPLPMETSHGSLFEAEGLARRFKVSTKTISRWRRRGLIGCWHQSDAGETRLLFSRRAVESFIAGNLELVRRGSSFRLMDDNERARIVGRARELAGTGPVSLHAVTLRLAEETGRAIETIRYTLRRFDFDNPGEALFDRLETTRQIDLGKVILAAHLEGDAPARIAERFGRSEADIREIIRTERISAIAAAPIEYIPSAEFDDPTIEADILSEESAEYSDADADSILTRIPSELPPYLQALYRTQLLSAADERRLFRKMNFLLSRAEIARASVAADPARAATPDVDAIDRSLSEARVVKNRLIQSNLRLVVSIAKRHASGDRASSLFEMISDGNIALIRAVEKFDYSRGFRFSTYATWAITRSFARSVPEERCRSDRFRTGQDETLMNARDPRAIPFPAEDSTVALQCTVDEGLSTLDERERLVVERHFGIHGDAQTLDEIGRELSISKERVRQIEIRALRKLRISLGDNGAELLAG